LAKTDSVVESSEWVDEAGMDMAPVVAHDHPYYDVPMSDAAASDKVAHN
jgi:hypothetical protein